MRSWAMCNSSCAVRTGSHFRAARPTAPCMPLWYRKSALPTQYSLPTPISRSSRLMRPGRLQTPFSPAPSRRIPNLPFYADQTWAYSRQQWTRLPFSRQAIAAAAIGPTLVLKVPADHQLIISAARHPLKTGTRHRYQRSSASTSSAVGFAARSSRAHNWHTGPAVCS